MRLRILKRPTATIGGVSLDHFQVGQVYELGTQVACVFLAEQWAKIVPDDARVTVRPPPPEVAEIEPLVLVVDDEPDMRRFTQSLLTSHGYHVIVAAHGRDAIARLREQCPDLIVLDLNMPVMNGWQFRTEQRFLTSTHAAVPVLLLTGEADAAAHADKLRAVGVITKPFDPDELLAAVSAVVGHPGNGSGATRSLAH